MTPDEALQRLQALPDAYYEGQAHPDEATQVLCQLLSNCRACADCGGVCPGQQDHG